MSLPLEGTQSAALAINRVHYTHDAMIDLMIANPIMSQGELAGYFGYTQAWVSRIINSDAFLARLALRKEDLVDPVLVATIEEKLRAVASKSLDVVLEKLTLSGNADLALKAAELSTKALGFGARTNTIMQNNFVVALPPKLNNPQEWMTTHTPSIEPLEGELVR